MGTQFLILGAATANPFYWYLTRDLAIGAYIALTVTTLLGLSLSLSRTTGERVRWFITELHNIAGVLTGVLIAGHLLTLMVDSYMPFSLANILLPLSQPTNTIAVDVGVFAMYGMVAILLSTWLKQRIKYGLWKAIHFVSFPTFFLVTIHGWFTGTDTATWWMPALYLGATLAVGSMIATRLFMEPGQRRVRDAKLLPSSLVTALVVGSLGVFAMMVVQNLSSITAAVFSTNSAGDDSSSNNTTSSQPSQPFPQPSSNSRSS